MNEYRDRKDKSWWLGQRRGFKNKEQGIFRALYQE